MPDHIALYRQEAFLASVDGWYLPEQLAVLADVVAETSLHTRVEVAVEIGCWLGRSTAVLSRALPPGAQLICIDHWIGNVTEGEQHPTVVQANASDVFAEFQQNMVTWATPNWQVMRMASVEAARRFEGEYQILHLDAGHHYDDVRRDLEAWLPMAARPSLICGDDWLTAHAGRDDLGGGVERAVSEILGQPETVGNLWYVRLG